MPTGWWCSGRALSKAGGFSEEEDLLNGPRVTLISEQLWERRFDRDPDVLGDAVSLSGDPYTIIGVVGDGFDVSDFGTRPL